MIEKLCSLTPPKYLYKQDAAATEPSVFGMKFILIWAVQTAATVEKAAM
jgi:hypothetical protein